MRCVAAIGLYRLIAADARHLARDSNCWMRKTIIVVAADKGLRRPVAFALEVEEYATQSYDTFAGSRRCFPGGALHILDDDILRSEPQAAAHFLSNRGAGPYCWLMACRPFSNGVDYATLTKPFTGPDLLSVTTAWSRRLSSFP